ncbi:flagellar type III secretion system pore protein FliP [Christensenellaceae bacterium OttesenSCG-928-K19]|nr:flagellar type III secretion system pore protein FliP [Christensenellaceae bacterium OttesenSCG-928-K19]
MKKKKKAILFAVVLVLCIVILSGCASTEDNVNNLEEGDGPLSALFGSRSQSLQLVGLLTVLSIAPSILIMMSGFVRIVMVFSFTRNALGLSQMPPNQVIVVIALFVTFFVMAPVFNSVMTDAIEPYIAEEITFDEAMDAAEEPIRKFMLSNTRKSDLNTFIGFSDTTDIETIDDVPMSTIIPAFLTSELKTAMIIGFFIYIPFIVVDMVVASTLMAMGMMMLPPVTISLPFKVLLFILIDGWNLTMQTLISGFN